MNQQETIELAVKQLFGEGNLDIVEKIFSNNYIVHAANKDYKGHKSIKKFLKQLRSAIPDVKVKKLEFLNQSDTVITWRRTFSGTHKEDMMGISASQKKIKWTEMVVSHFDGEKISEEWVTSELMGELLLRCV